MSTRPASPRPLFRAQHTQAQPAGAACPIPSGAFSLTLRRALRLILFCAASLSVTHAVPVFAATVWQVRVEEPTGTERRDNEVVSVPLSRLAGHREGFSVVDPHGRELPWQVTSDSLLFPASLIPGELPVYRIGCCGTEKTPAFANKILLKKLSMNRVEFGNPFFRATIDLHAGAITELYTLRAQSPRVLNLIELTPEGPDALKGDVHEHTPAAATFSPAPVEGVTGPNAGWTSTGGTGSFTNVEIKEAGPLRGVIRLTRGAETWEITWTSGSPWFRWKARGGFRFTAISASPYEPFNRCLEGTEDRAPTGPGEPEPSPHDIGGRDWPKLPGGHMVYYQLEQDYGALGVAALDASLNWKGACTRRVIAETTASANTEVAITFPGWDSGDTFLQARHENRRLRHPLLVEVISSQPETSLHAGVPAAREPQPVFSHNPVTPFTTSAIPLDGAWELAFSELGQDPPATGWRTVQVPGSVHPQWLKPEQIYTHDAEWLSRKQWWYRKRFTPPKQFQNKTLRLQFDATDYYADAWLNGERLGRHEGYIDPYEYDVTAQVKPGEENTLLVRIWTPVTYYWKHRPYTVKGAYGAVDQKPDNITPEGITRSVRLVASTPAFIRDVAVATRLNDDAGSSAEVELQLDSTGIAPSDTANYIWEATLTPRNFASSERLQVRIPASTAPVLTRIHVDHPSLWWTWDHGKPNLYTLEVRLLDSTGQAVDGRTLTVGIREVEKIGWNFYLNRKRMFIRGTNYYDPLFMSEMTRTRYERDVQLMTGMNVNLIRLHCHFSNPELYDLADEKGILIWQDFLEAWYPHDADFARRAALLYDAHIRYARNHPSVAIWITSDEEDFENYRVITKHLALRPVFVDLQRRPVHRSTGRFGDSHIYHGWYDGSIWEYTQMSEQFVSELGATSLPNYETLQKYMPGLWPISQHEDEWTWRRLQIPEAMRAWGSPEGLTLQQYIPRTQAYVARLFQIALERMRERKSEGAGGIIHFHAIDIWPSVTMAAIDFDRVPTKTYDTVRRSFAPVAALFQYDRDRWPLGDTFTCKLWTVNDNWTAVPGATVRWWIQPATASSAKPQAANKLASGALASPLPADSSQLAGRVEWKPTAPGSYELHAALHNAKGTLISENLFEFTVTPPDARAANPTTNQAVAQ